MATRYWQGQADTTAQVSQAGVTGYDAATTYSVSVGGEVIATELAAGSAAATVSGLATAWNAVTGNPYATTVTASSTGATLKLTADVAGNPFTVTVSATGGSGSWSSVTTPTANAGPNDWTTAANWSGDSVPVSTDDVMFRDSAVDVRWGLDQSAVDLRDLVIEASYTGKIGLSRTSFTTGSDGSTSTVKPEYREDYLTIGWDAARIGEILGPGSPAGASRLKLNNDKSGSSTTEVFSTSTSSADLELPAVRLLAGNAGADVFVREASGGLGLAADEPGETATFGDIEVSDRSPATRVFVGEGTTLTNFTQQGGVNTLRAAATVTLVKVLDGELAIEGADYAVTTLTVEGGTCYPNNLPTGGSAITTVNIDGGTVDGTRSRQARTWSTVNLVGPGSVLTLDDNVVAITTLNEPDGPYSLTVG